MRSDVEIAVSAGDRARLEAIVAAPGSPQKHVWRARIILLSGDGVGTMAIARQAGVAKPTVWRWQERFMTEGMAGAVAREVAATRHCAVAGRDRRPGAEPDRRAAAR